MGSNVQTSSNHALIMHHVNFQVQLIRVDISHKCFMYDTKLRNGKVLNTTTRTEPEGVKEKPKKEKRKEKERKERKLK